MALHKTCSKCRSLYKYGEECPRGCSKEIRKESNKIYDSYQRKNSKFYNSQEWKALRKTCMNRFDRMCVWSFFKYNKMIPGTLAHHIIEIEEDPSKMMELSNLVWLSEEAHREIHKLYRQDKKAIQSELFEMVLKY